MCSDTPIAKQAFKVFEDLTQAYKGKVSIGMQSAELLEEHADPLLAVFDKRSRQVLSMTYNFIDVLGGKPNLTVDSKYSHVT